MFHVLNLIFHVFRTTTKIELVTTEKCSSAELQFVQVCLWRTVGLLPRVLCITPVQHRQTMTLASWSQHKYACPSTIIIFSSVVFKTSSLWSSFAHTICFPSLIETLIFCGRKWWCGVPIWTLYTSVPWSYTDSGY